MLTFAVPEICCSLNTRQISTAAPAYALLHPALRALDNAPTNWVVICWSRWLPITVSLVYVKQKKIKTKSSPCGVLLFWLPIFCCAKCLGLNQRHNNPTTSAWINSHTFPKHSRNARLDATLTLGYISPCFGDLPSENDSQDRFPRSVTLPTSWHQA